jgi:Chemotaxis phosphatase CheX
MTDIGVADWLQAAVDSAVELGTTALGFDQASAEALHPESLPSGLGSYVPLLAPGLSLHIGLVADGEHCTELARALLGLSPEEDASQDDVTDAIGEIANMLGGGVKTRLISREPKLQLGLPIFIDGKIQPGAHSETAVGNVSLGVIPIKVLVIRGHKPS